VAVVAQAVPHPVEEYEEQAGDNALAGRLADHFAAIRLTAEIVHEAIELPWDYSDPVEPLWDDLFKELGDADRPAAALRHVMAWATAHQSDFYRPGTADRQPAGGWAGVWAPSVASLVPVPGKAKPWEVIALLPPRLESVLEEGGYDMSEVVKNWMGREWLEVTEEEDTVRSRLKVKLGKHSTWAVAVRYEGAVAAGAV
jgi:hypothetical protein